MHATLPLVSRGVFHGQAAIDLHIPRLPVRFGRVSERIKGVSRLAVRALKVL